MGKKKKSWYLFRYQYILLVVRSQIEQSIVNNLLIMFIKFLNIYNKNRWPK